MSKKTVIIGASTNPERYAYRAAVALKSKGHEAVSVGLRAGEINGIKVLDSKPEIKDVDTVTLYVGPANQPYWYDYILSLKPERVIFNPGTENEEFEDLLKKNNIEPVEACTLVMLSIGNY
jgi:predicted CoA-binding protein